MKMKQIWQMLLEILQLSNKQWHGFKNDLKCCGNIQLSSCQCIFIGNISHFAYATVYRFILKTAVFFINTKCLLC